MIKKIKLKNFQSIKDGTLELGKITVIKGKSDSGKSSIVRAIKALATNSFSKEYAHFGEFPFGIAIQNEKGVVLARRTSKGVEYQIGNKVLSKTQRQIPTEVQDLLGMKPYKIDDDLEIDFNIRSQFDMPFLIAETPSTIAKIIGRVSMLNLVMSANRKIVSDKQKLSQEISYLSNKKMDLEQSLKKFSDLDWKRTILNECKDKIDKVEKLKAESSSIGTIVSNFSSIETEILSTKVLDQKMLDKADKDISDCLKVQSIIEDLATIDSSIAELKSKIKFIPENAIKEIDSLVELETLILEYLSVETAKDSLITYFKDIKVTEADIDRLTLSVRVNNIVEEAWEITMETGRIKKELENNEKELSKFNSELSKLLESNKICPFSKGFFHEDCKLLLLKD